MLVLRAAIFLSIGSTAALHVGPMIKPSTRRSGSIRAVTDELEGDEAALYAFGTNIGRQLNEMKVFSPRELDTVLMGVKDIITQAEPKCDVRAYLPNGLALFQAKEERARERTSEAGETALAAAAAEPGAEKTDSGLVFLMVTAGEGAMATAEDTVRCHYEGRLLDGTVFDSSYKRGEPLEFELSGVIQGWVEGLQMMNAGSKAKLTIPSDLAYGEMGTGPIPGGATLVFDIELLAINP